ncbi:c-type cytochrome [Scleromatobacter humisilvae]|uniref:Cytochrome c n=1 Tax=Scleromatobacter humisilvae TaxID=2897159 RepID=A0A9X1YJZ0_9BURK|nr:cytochrome c [Scleromatobacter humisilvae]MCK9686275.1 cytochrome c [Scleromatobacter humisilvae]
MTRWLLLVAAACALAGCERTMKNMYVQPKLGPDAGSPLWADGKGSRPPPPGSVAIASGDLAKTSSGRHGRDEIEAREAADAASAPPRIDLALLRRGQARYDVDCAPCHSIVGDGDGMVVRRGFPRPPTFHQARLRDVPDRHLFDVITQGYGVMVPYADRVTPQDRWAIVAYIRALQLSQDAHVADLPVDLQAGLRALPAPPRAPASRASAPALGASDPETS